LIGAAYTASQATILKSLNFLQQCERNQIMRRRIVNLQRLVDALTIMEIKEE
jgi:hypothetical protein